MLSERSCEGLASVLMSEQSNLRELDLSSNYLDIKEVILLSTALENPYCKLETLRSARCVLNAICCSTQGLRTKQV